MSETMRFLVVGDPHVRVEDLDECERLMGLVHDVAAESCPDAIVFMGDLFHTHALVHVEVVDFWVRWMERTRRWRRRAIRGNHDGPHDPRPGVHALRALGNVEGVTVVDEPQEWGGILWMPYFRDPLAFVAACKRSALPTVYCHQEFDGAQFEGGFYAKDGVPPTTIPQEQVVSGHIHAGQEFGKVWYVGAPRWMTVADANRERFIWLVEHDIAGRLLSKKSIPTAGVCSPIVRVEEEPGKISGRLVFPEGARVFVDLRGPSGWLAERAAAWGAQARVRCTATDGAAPRLRESDGVGVAARKYFEAYEPRHGADRAEFRTLAESRLGEAMRGDA